MSGREVSLVPCTCHYEDDPYCPRHTPLPGESNIVGGSDLVRLQKAADDVIDAYHRESEDANDGEFALWKADDLINAIIRLRDIRSWQSKETP